MSLFLWHFIVLATYAVDLPYWDEWDVSLPRTDLHGAALLRWMSSWSNEHRPFFTRLEVVLASRWGGYNFVTLQLAHFILYGALLLLIARAAKNSAPRMPGWAPYAFCCFLLSTVPWEVHSWAISGCWTLALVFFVAAAVCLFDDRQRPGALAAGAFLMVLSFFCNSTGLLTGLMLAAWFALFKLARALRKEHSAARELAGLCLVSIVCAAGLFFWSRGFHRPDELPAPTLPGTRAFWAFFTNIVSNGFGFQRQSIPLGLACLFLVICPGIWAFWRHRAAPPVRVWRSCGILAALLGAMAGIDMARAGLGVETGKAPRYAIVAMMLVPFTAVAWSLALEHERKLHDVVLWGLFAFCCFGFARDWSVAPYRAAARLRQDGFECLRRAASDGGEVICPTIYPRPLTSQVAYATQHRLPFYEAVLASVVPEVEFRSERALLAAYRLTPCPPRTTAGYIDFAKPTCGASDGACDVLVRGWAIDPFARLPAARVWVVEDGEVLAAALPAADRPDVAKALGAPDTIYSGWTATIRGAHTAARLDPARFVAYALLPDRSRLVKLDGPLEVVPR